MSESMHPLSVRLHEILKELGELHDAKQADYGTKENPFANICSTEDWGVEPWIGALIRATDKMHRLQSFVKNGTLKNEGVEDSLRDLSVYAMIALVLFEQKTALPITLPWKEAWVIGHPEPPFIPRPSDGELGEQTYVHDNATHQAESRRFPL